MSSARYCNLSTLSDFKKAFDLALAKLELDALRAPARWPGAVYHNALKDLREEFNGAVRDFQRNGGRALPRPSSSPAPIHATPIYYSHYISAPQAVAGLRAMFNPPPEMKKLKPETTWGEIEAFRVWRIFNAEPRLISSYTAHEWEPGGVMKAHQELRDFDGDWDRTGVHAWKSMVEVVEHGARIARSGDGSTLAFGRVKLWGDVVEHQRGYRAEFARIIGIDDLVKFECNEMYYDMSKDRMDETLRSVWLGPQLEDLRDRYFPDRKKKS